MREYKFRAWDKTNQKMFFFDEIRIDSEYNLLGFHEKSCSSYGDLDIDEDNFELMQFTGLHDKNGKEIYEGDIVIQESEYSAFVIKWGLLDIDAFQIYGFNLWSFEPIKEEYFEVLGNVYENPELLNGEVTK